MMLYTCLWPHALILKGDFCALKNNLQLGGCEDRQNDWTVRVTSRSHPGQVARAVASMAAKRKQRKQGQTNWKMASKYKKNHPGAEDFGEEEDADSGTVKDENKEDELSLDEVLHLGGTRVSFQPR